MKRVMVSLTAVICPLLAGSGFAQRVDHVSSSLFSGPFNCITVEGDLAYCGSSRYLEIFHIEDPENPVQIGGYLLPEDNTYVHDIKVYGAYAYLTRADYALNQGFLEIVNIENPSQPYLGGRYTELCFPQEVFISGELAFVADTALWVIDISDPSGPVLVGAYSAGTSLYHVFVSEGNAYVPHDEAVDIVDMSDPSQPIFLCSVDLPSNASDVLINDNFAYLSWSWYIPTMGWGANGFIIMDVNNPGAPSFVGQYCCGGGATDQIFVSGHYAYIHHFGMFDEIPFGGIEVVDISDPEDPAYVTYYSEMAVPVDASISGNDLYSVGFYGYNIDLLEVIDFSDPSTPVIVGNYYCPYVTAVSATSDFAFLGCENPGLVIADASDPYYPEVVGNLDIEGAATDISVADNYAYMIDYGHFIIADISDPTEPSIAGELGIPNFGHNVFVSDNYAYVGCFSYSSNSVFIIDISDIYNPIPCWNYNTSDDPQDVYVIDHYAFVANSNDGLLILDISDPCDPIECGVYETDHQATGIFVDGDYAYLSMTESGILIMEITNPCDPELIGTCYLPGPVDGIFVSGNYAYAYVGQPLGFIYVIDISNPYSPIYIADYETHGSVRGVFVDDEYIYVADFNSFLILHFDPQTGIKEVVNIPYSFTLSQNHPNPFNATTIIRYSLPKASDVAITIYDILGKTVEAIDVGEQSAGEHQIVWNAASYPSGVYFYRILVGDYSEAKKMLLLK